jgi:hypothetical protein
VSRRSALCPGCIDTRTPGLEHTGVRCDERRRLRVRRASDDRLFLRVGEGEDLVGRAASSWPGIRRPPSRTSTTTWPERRARPWSCPAARPTFSCLRSRPTRFADWCRAAPPPSRSRPAEMPGLADNVSMWNDVYDSSQRGDERSDAWGGVSYQWWVTLFSRIQAFVPAQRILEIAPGYGAGRTTCASSATSWSPWTSPSRRWLTAGSASQATGA